MARFINALLGRGGSDDDLLEESASLLSDPEHTRLWTMASPRFIRRRLAEFVHVRRPQPQWIQCHYKNYLKDIPRAHQDRPEDRVALHLPWRTIMVGGPACSQSCQVRESWNTS